MTALTIHSASVHLRGGGLQPGAGQFGRALLQPGRAGQARSVDDGPTAQRVRVRPHRQAPVDEPPAAVRQTGDSRTQLYADHEATWPGRSWRYINFLL